MKKFIKLSCMTVSMALSAVAFAEAPHPEAASVDITAEIGGSVVNGGLVLGGDAYIETSIATFHDGDIDGGVTINVEMVNYGVATANGGLAIGGDMCSKVSIGSVGANTCAHDLSSR